MLPILHRQFQEQRDQVLDGLAAHPLAKDFTRRQRKDYLDELTDWVKLTAALQESISSELASLVLEVGRQAMLDLGLDPNYFDATATDVAGYPDERSLKVAIAINDETQKQLRASISAGIAANETTNELRARIETVFGAALTYRASRITQTEITSAQGLADVAAWKQTGVVTGKEWYTAEDELVCPFCGGMDGLIVDVDEYFFRQGDVINAGGESMTVGFGDIVSPPLHVNCRCVLMPVKPQ